MSTAYVGEHQTLYCAWLSPAALLHMTVQLMHFLPLQAALNEAKQELEAKRAALKEQNKVSKDHHTEVHCVHSANFVSCVVYGEYVRMCVC